MTYTPLPIDTRTAEELVSGVVDLAAAVTAPGLGRAERLSRTTQAAHAAGDLRAMMPTLAPYLAEIPNNDDGHPRHSRIRDHMLVNDIVAKSSPEALAARERLDQDAQQRTISRQLRAWADLGPILDATPTVASVGPQPQAARFLELVAHQPTEKLGPATEVPDVWSYTPETPAPTDPRDVPFGLFEIEGTRKPWLVAKLGLNASRQVIDWPAGAFDAEAALTYFVGIDLETQILNELATGAPTAVSFEAAEIAVGTAWVTGADLILCHGADRPKIVRSYADEGIDPTDRPTILATGGATPGTALVIAAGAVWVEASDIDFMAADEPKIFGKSIAAFRYGRGHLRKAGAIQKVTVA